MEVLNPKIQEDRALFLKSAFKKNILTSCIFENENVDTYTVHCVQYMVCCPG